MLGGPPSTALAGSGGAAPRRGGGEGRRVPVAAGGAVVARAAGVRPRTDAGPPERRRHGCSVRDAHRPSDVGPGAEARRCCRCPVAGCRSSTGCCATPSTAASWRRTRMSRSCAKGSSGPVRPPLPLRPAAEPRLPRPCHRQRARLALTRPAQRSTMVVVDGDGDDEGHQPDRPRQPRHGREPHRQQHGTGSEKHEHRDAVHDISAANACTRRTKPGSSTSSARSISSTAARLARRSPRPPPRRLVSFSYPNLTVRYRNNTVITPIRLPCLYRAIFPTARRTSRGQGRPRDEANDVAILDATERLLGRRGYEAMTVDQVAAEAGVSKPTIYLRYRSKRDLVAAMIDRLRPPLPDGRVDRWPRILSP